MGMKWREKTRNVDQKHLVEIELNLKKCVNIFCRFAVVSFVSTSVRQPNGIELRRCRYLIAAVIFLQPNAHNYLTKIFQFFFRCGV